MTETGGEGVFGGEAKKHYPFQSTIEEELELLFYATPSLAHHFPNTSSHLLVCADDNIV